MCGHVKDIKTFPIRHFLVAMVWFLVCQACLGFSSIGPVHAHYFSPVLGQYWASIMPSNGPVLDQYSAQCWASTGPVFLASLHLGSTGFGQGPPSLQETGFFGFAQFWHPRAPT